MVKRIDFHIHTLPDKDKDNPFSFSLDWIRKYVSTLNIDAIAITNHNFFNQENYNQICNALNLIGVKVFPGIELSLETGHVNLVGDCTDECFKALTELTTKSKELGEKNGLTLDELLTIKNIRSFIYIFECGKANSIEIPPKLSDVTALLGVSNQLKFNRVFNNIETYPPALFSDAHSTDDKNDLRHDILKLGNKNTFVQTDSTKFCDIKAAFQNKEKVNINKSMLHNIYSIEGVNVSSGLNLIVGKRGTGKTTFIENVHKLFPDEVYEIKQFETSNQEKFLKQQQEQKGNIAFDNWISQNEVTIESIKKWIGALPDDKEPDLQKYISSLKSFAKKNQLKNSASQSKLFNSANLEIVNFESLKDTLNKLKDIINNKKVWSEYLTKTKQNKKYFIETYNELRALFIAKQNEIQIKRKANEILDIVKEILVKHTGAMKLPDFNFSDFIKRKYKEQAINKSMEKITQRTIISSEEIAGYLLTVSIESFKNASQYKSDMHTDVAVKEDLINYYIDKDFVTYFKNLSTKKFFDISKLSQFIVHREIELKTESGAKASGGQATAFALILKLRESASKQIILIDEPEASLDNKFIKDELIKEIKHLATNSTVFVITHNSTLGALLEPDYLIVTKYNGSYNILSGEYSSAMLKDKVGTEVPSYNDFVEAMEAGIDTYKRKGNSYESLQNQ